MRTGYSPLFAGAVGSGASTGGQINASGHGAGAFVMAELLGTSYANIALAAAIPALLYFASVGLMVYFEAQRKQLRCSARDEFLAPWRPCERATTCSFPCGVLVYLLVIEQLSPMLSGFLRHLHPGGHRLAVHRDP